MGFTWLLISETLEISVRYDELHICFRCEKILKIDHSKTEKWIWKIEQTLGGNIVEMFWAMVKKVKCNYHSKINNRRIFRFKHHPSAGTRYDFEPRGLVSEET